ncbi:MAG: flagellar biosynthetic protein FliO [Deltaproteobacteria bacterium]|nr:flagellar biosynthetic protein FliO [Deltaproteobacteria bacterium]
MLLAAQSHAPTATGYGLFIVQTVAGLALLAVGAWAFVRLVGPWMRGTTARRHGRMRIVERLALDQRRAICIVEVDGAELLVGTGDGGTTLLKELPRKAAEGGAPTGNGPS